MRVCSAGASYIETWLLSQKPLPTPTSAEATDAQRPMLPRTRLAMSSPQIPLQPTRHRPTVLDRPAPLTTDTASPPQQLQMRLGSRRLNRLLRYLTADLVDRHHRVRTLVRVHAEYHHGPVAFH